MAKTYLEKPDAEGCAHAIAAVQSMIEVEEMAKKLADAKPESNLADAKPESNLVDAKPESNLAKIDPFAGRMGEIDE